MIITSEPRFNVILTLLIIDAVHAYIYGNIGALPHHGIDVDWKDEPWLPDMISKASNDRG